MNKNKISKRFHKGMSTFVEIMLIVGIAVTLIIGAFKLIGPAIGGKSKTIADALGDETDYSGGAFSGGTSSHHISGVANLTKIPGATISF